MPRRSTQSSRICSSYCGEGVCRISLIETVEHARQRRAQRGILDLNGRGQRRAQKDDA